MTDQRMVANENDIGISEQALTAPGEYEASLLTFYAKGGIDHRGRTFEQLLAASDLWLESTHDYVQWLFPLGVASAYNPHAPLLDQFAVQAFAESDVLRIQQRRAFTRMMRFYGFDVEEDIDAGVLTAVYVDRADNFDQRGGLWITSGNHNYMRITRILKSLSLLSSPLHAQGLGAALQLLYRDFGARVGRKSFSIWTACANGYRKKA